jgi:multicomponent Na+:H+ antiporter subunit E
MGTVDTEGVQIQLALGAITYVPWLLWEIVKSGWSVSRIIMDPNLPISPTMTRVKATQKTSAGINVYANSITLTPGTITTNVVGDELTVHALVTEGALDLEGGSMDRRVSRFERGL